MQRKPALDGLRGIAIALVILSHLGHLNDGGQIGVGLFFVLSGFLITKLILGEIDRTGGLNLWHFYGRRARRLLPAFGLLLAVGAIVGVLFHDMPAQVGRIAIAGSYMANWLGIVNLRALGWLVHTWSLSVEEQFYLVWPLLLVIAYKRGRLPLVIGIGIGIGASLLARFLVRNDSFERVWIGTDTRAADLLIGALASLIWRNGAPTTWKLPLLATGVVIAAAVLVAQGLPVPLAEPLAAVSGTIAVVGAASVDVPVLAWAPLRRLGVISYGVYLWHYPLVVATGTRTWGQQVFIVVAAVVVAELSYRFLEQPILTGRWRRPKSEQIPAT